MALAACSQAQVDPFERHESVVPGTIGVAVREENAKVVVAAVGRAGPAAQSGVRVGDVVVRYNGEEVRGARHFYRLVVDSPPGSVARLELVREGTRRFVEVPVEQLDVMPRV